MSEQPYTILDGLTGYASEARRDAEQFETLASNVEDIEEQWTELDPEFKSAFRTSAIGIKPRLLGAPTVGEFEGIIDDLETALKDPERQAARQALEGLCETINISLAKESVHAIEERLRTLDSPQLRAARAAYESCRDRLEDGPDVVQECTREYINDASDRVSRLTAYDRLLTEVKQLRTRHDVLSDVEAAFEKVPWSPDDATSLHDEQEYYRGLDQNSTGADTIVTLVKSIDESVSSLPSMIPVAEAVDGSLDGSFDGSLTTLEKALECVVEGLSEMSELNVLQNVTDLVEHMNGSFDDGLSTELKLAIDGIPFEDVREAYDEFVNTSPSITVDYLGIRLDKLKDAYSEWAEQTVERLHHHAATAEAVSSRLPEAPKFSPLTDLTVSQDVKSAPDDAIEQLRTFAMWVQDLQTHLNDEHDASSEVVEHWLRYEMGDTLSLQTLHDDGIVGDLLDLTDLTIQKEGLASDV